MEKKKIYIYPNKPKWKHDYGQPKNYIDGMSDNFETIYSQISIISGSFSKYYLVDIGDGVIHYQIINKGDFMYQYSAFGVNIRKRVVQLSPLTSQIPGWAQNTHADIQDSVFSIVVVRVE